MPSHKQTPCRAALPRNINDDSQRSVARCQRVRTISPQITKSEPRGVLVSVRHFFPRTGNLLQIIPIAKFSGCGAACGAGCGAGLRPAGSRSLWLRDSGGVGTSRQFIEEPSSIFHLPSSIFHLPPSRLVVEFSEFSESFQCILFTEFSDSFSCILSSESSES